MAATKTNRILHVIPTLGRGGAERQLVSLVVNATQDEHIVCYLREPSDFASELREHGIEVIRLDSSGPSKWLKGAAGLTRVVKQNAPDIVQTWLLDASISARLGQLLGPKVQLITALQSPDYEPETIRMANWPRRKTSVLRRIDQLTLRLSAPRFVACSEFVKKSALEHLGMPEASIEVIYNSVDPETLRCAPGEAKQLRDSLGIPADGVVFLNVGRLDPPKGHEYLMRAFQKVVEVEPRSYLVIAGDGPSRERLTAVAKELDIADRTHLLGRRTDVGALLEMADVFVFPSWFEGLGLALVEAMFKQVPCIVSRIDVLLEVVAEHESGLTAAPASVDELAEAMTVLAKDGSLRKKMGERGKQIAESRFHQRVTVPQWESLYTRLLAQT
jgi:glycosyltransferase involved in cell wall biosynthesis